MGIYTDAIDGDNYIFFLRLNIEVKQKHRIRKRKRGIKLKLSGLCAVIFSVKRTSLKQKCKK
jgi:hypothetical protein